MSIIIDFETRSKCDLKRTGAWRYAEDPSTSVLCLAYAIDKLPVSMWLPGEEIPKDLAYYIKYGFTVEAHNSFFERAIWRNIMVPQFGWPDIKDSQWRCSAARAAVLALPRALDAVGEALSLPTRKSQDGKRIMMKLSHPRTPTKDNPAIWNTDREDLRILRQYCKQDVEAERCLSDTIPQLIPTEQKVWTLDQKINERGIMVDLPAVKAALFIIEQYTDRLLKEFQQITGGQIDSPTQRDKVLAWLRGEGVHIKGLTKNDIVDTLEDKLKRMPSEKTKRVLEIRQAISKTSTAKYKALLDSVCRDGRLRDTLMYHGASTGRWTGKAIQPQNLPKNNSRINLGTYFKILKSSNLDTFELCYPEVMQTLSSTIRGVFIPAKNHVFFGGDFSAVEARVLFWLAGDERALSMFRKGEDLYKDLAATIYQKPVAAITKEEREMGKRGVLGCGYGLGHKKFMETTKAFARVEIPEELAVRVVDAYRTKYAHVVQFWYSQERSAYECIETKKAVVNGRITWRMNNKFLECQLPSYRCLYYYDPKIENCPTPWGDVKATITYMAVNPKTKQWSRDRTYGGKIAENITQAVARDLMAEAMLRVENAGYSIILTVHDEVLSESNKGSVDEFVNIMTTLPEWAKGLPINAEGWSGDRYTK
jgi:DNA polymerase